MSEENAGEATENQQASVEETVNTEQMSESSQPDELVASSEEIESEQTTEVEDHSASAESSMESVDTEQNVATTDGEAEFSADEVDEASEATAKPEPEGMGWYIVHTYSGFENKVKLGLEERIRTHKMEHLFGEILVPEESVVELVKGQKRTAKRKIFPSYMLVRMVLTDETWHLVKDTPKVTGFVGGNKIKPQPISDDEVARMTNRIREGAAKPKHRISFSDGEKVRVVDGPFANFNGVVEEVNEDKGKVKVNVSIFGRPTPVELDFIQVEKL